MVVVWLVRPWWVLAGLQEMPRLGSGRWPDAPPPQGKGGLATKGSKDAGMEWLNEDQGGDVGSFSVEMGTLQASEPITLVF